MSTKEKIKKNIVDQLYWDARVDASDIEVTVDDGNVQLKGKVGSLEEKNAAETDAKAVLGVLSVTNDLKVEFAPTIEIPVDVEIADNIRTTLSLNFKIDKTDIDVSVTGGVVTLEGTVSSLWEKARAEYITSTMTGVIDVLNKLKVVPTESVADEVIAEDIVNSLTRNLNVTVDSVNVEVENGIVNLSGTVTDWNAYDAVITTVKNTTGVVDYIDQLQIELA
jgi:hyperosmotically inducible periplasmic protein